MEKSAAILLRRIRFSETSLILTWLTEEHGKVKTMAKGALRPKSAFAGVIDLFFEVELAYARSSRSELHTLREVALVNPREALRRDYGRVEMAAYFVELMELATELEHPVPELYDLLRRALGYLEGHPADLRALLHYERELTRRLGLAAEGIAPSETLARTLHRLPESRAGLMRRL